LDSFVHNNDLTLYFEQGTVNDSAFFTGDIFPFGKKYAQI
jgi:hypothetical protein